MVINRKLKTKNKIIVFDTSAWNCMSKIRVICRYAFRTPVDTWTSLSTVQTLFTQTYSIFFCIQTESVDTYIDDVFDKLLF